MLRNEGGRIHGNGGERWVTVVNGEKGKEERLILLTMLSAEISVFAFCLSGSSDISSKPSKNDTR